MAVSCGVGRRRGSDPALLWLWRRLVSTAPIRPLAWEPPYAAGAAQQMAKDKKKKKKKMTRQTLGGLTQWVITVQEKDGAQLQIQGRKIEIYSLG